MSKPFNPFGPLKKGSLSNNQQLNSHLAKRRRTQMNHFNFFPNSRKTSFERGESAGAQLHLVEKNTRETTNRVLNNIIELTPKSSKNKHQDEDRRQSVESDLSHKFSLDKNKEKEEEANHQIDQSFDQSKKEMNTLLYEHKNMRNSKSIDFTKNVQKIRQLRYEKNSKTREKLKELDLRKQNSE